MSDPTVPHSPGLPRRRCVVRGFVGHTESLGATFRAVAEALATQATLEPEAWGSAFATDPWPRPLPAELPEATRARLRQHYQTQRPGSVRTLTFVTCASRSLVTLEDHEGALVLAITYEAATEPAASGDPLQAVPADARAAVGTLPFATATTLQAQLFYSGSEHTAGNDRVTLLLGLAALWHDDLRLGELLRRIARLKTGDWALRAAGIAVAQREGYALLLHELWAGEKDPELQAELTTLLGEDPPRPGPEAAE